MSHYPPPPQHKRAPKTSDISKEYPEYSNGDLHTQRLPDKMITTDRAPSPTQINPINNYSNQIYYISKMQIYERTRKNLATKTTKLSKMTTLPNYNMECLNRISLRQCLSSYIHLHCYAGTRGSNSSSLRDIWKAILAGHA